MYKTPGSTGRFLIILGVFCAGLALSFTLFRLTYNLEPGFFHNEVIAVSWVILFSGITLTILLALYLHNILRHPVATERICDQRTAELRLANEEWNATFDSMSDGISIQDADFNIINVNESLCRMLGKKREEIIGKKCYQVFHGKDSPISECPFVRTKISKRGDHAEFFEISLQKWLSESVSPILDDKGNIQKIVHTIRDVTERKHMEELRDEFVSTVSHELRTPLSIIREGTSQVFEGMHGEITDRQAHFLSMVINSIDRITRIVNSLLNLSKMESGKMQLNKEKTDLVELIKKIKEDFTVHIVDKGLEIRQDLPEARVEAYFDKDKITEVFVNLLGNAMKFTEKGYIKISVMDKKDHVECSVADTGRGISQENMPKLFNKFEQFDRMEVAGEQGVGLGLAICKNIIEMHDGRIWAESKINEGTKVIFTLPKD